MEHATTLPRESVHFHELRRAIEAAPRDRMPEVTAMLWRAFGEGRVSEVEAESLSALVEARKGSRDHRKPGALRRYTGSRPRTDASMERRRRWAASGRMPPTIACKFTLGEQAALAVVVVEIGKRGDCRLAHEHIAAVAGVSRSTVKRAIHQARINGLISVRERRLSRYRNETNVITIIDRSWLAWMRLARSGGGVQFGTGTNTVVSTRSPRRSSNDVKGAFGREGSRPVQGSADASERQSPPYKASLAMR